MSTLIGYRPLRLLCDLANPNHVRDQRTGLPPVISRGSPTQFQLALAIDRAICADISELLESIQLEVRASADPSDPALMSASALAAEVDDDLDEESWADGSAQHVALSFSAQECNLDAGEKWLTAWFVKPNGDPVTIALGKIKVIEDGAGDPGEAIVSDSDHYTRDEADARFALLNPDDGAFRISADGKFVQLLDQATLKWRSIWFNAGVLQTGPEED